LLDRVRERWGSQLDGELSGADFYDVKFETKKPLGLVRTDSSWVAMLLVTWAALMRMVVFFGCCD
jgi:hypothetical protein